MKFGRNRIRIAVLHDVCSPAFGEEINKFFDALKEEIEAAQMTDNTAQEAASLKKELLSFFEDA